MGVVKFVWPELKSSSTYGLEKNGQTFILKKKGTPESVGMGSTVIDTGCTLEIVYKGDPVPGDPVWYNYVGKCEVTITVGDLTFAIPPVKPDGKETIKIHVTNSSSGSVSFGGEIAMGYLMGIMPVEEFSD